LGGERSTAPACCAIGIRRVAPASATAARACAGESLSLRQAKSHRSVAFIFWAERGAQHLRAVRSGFEGLRLQAQPRPALVRANPSLSARQKATEWALLFGQRILPYCSSTLTATHPEAMHLTPSRLRSVAIAGI
jgi:hypothetical protein